MDEIIVQTKDDKLLIIVLEEGRIVEYYEYEKDNLSLMGNIYIGKVKDVVPKSNTLFVDIGLDKAGFLQLDDFSKKYKRDDKIIVQVKKDGYGDKGPKLSNELSIAGKYVALLLNSNIFACSRKLDSAEYVGLIEDFKKKLPDDVGLIIRTEAENVENQVIIDEVDELLEKYNEINEKIQSNEVGLIYDASNIENKIIIEFVKQTTKKIYTNNEEIYSKLLTSIEDNKAKLNYNFPEIINANTDFIDEFGLFTEYSRIFDRKIWLKSSGYIAVDRTEALTAIDVNSGKFLGKKDFEKEDTLLEINKEAAVESMRQIRLKNIGGIIVIDFINMQNEENRRAILEILNEEIKRDRSRIEVFGFTKLGLVEIARKKM